MNSRSASTSWRMECPEPAHMAHVRTWMSSTCRFWGMATGKPMGLPTPRAMRSMRWVRSWGVEKVMRRPMPEDSKPASGQHRMQCHAEAAQALPSTCVMGWMTLLVWSAADLFMPVSRSSNALTQKEEAYGSSSVCSSFCGEG